MERPGSRPGPGEEAQRHGSRSRPREPFPAPSGLQRPRRPKQGAGEGRSRGGAAAAAALAAAGVDEAEVRGRPLPPCIPAAGAGGCWDGLGEQLGPARTTWGTARSGRLHAPRPEEKGERPRAERRGLRGGRDAAAAWVPGRGRTTPPPRPSGKPGGAGSRAGGAPLAELRRGFEAWAHSSGARGPCSRDAAAGSGASRGTAAQALRRTASSPGPSRWCLKRARVLGNITVTSQLPLLSPLRVKRGEAWVLDPHLLGFDFVGALGRWGK